MDQVITPQPLFDTLENINNTHQCVTDYIASLNIPAATKERQLCNEFLKSYANSKDTFTSYRREVERLLHWSWLVCKKPLKEINRNDVRDYLKFIATPPKNWLATKIVDRFIAGPDGTRIANPTWRPFVVKVSKSARRHGKEPDKTAYQLSNKSMEAIFAVLSSMFTYLQQEEYLDINPVALIRQKKGYIQRQQTRKVTRKLSRVQWLYVINTCEELATDDRQHERTLFLMSAFYLLGLRISELAYTQDRPAVMGSFAPDKRGLWWYTTVGKGNKMRDVAYSIRIIGSAKTLQGIFKSATAAILPEEETPLFPKIQRPSGFRHASNP